MTLRHGPFRVDGYEVKYGTVRVPTPRIDGYITRMHSRMVDVNGRPLSPARLMLHHVAFKDLGSRTKPKFDQTYCPGSAGRRFYGTGEEDQTLDLPDGYGYRIQADDGWLVNLMLMNHRKTLDRAYLEYTMTIETDEQLVPVRPHWVGVVRGCQRDPIFTVAGGAKPGSVHLQTESWTVPSDGRIVAAGGHIHGGSYALALRQPKCRGRGLLASRPVYGGPDHVYYRVLPVLHEPGPVSTGWVTTRQGIGVRKGERLRLTAAYDASRMHVRAMGIMHLYIAPPVRNPSPELCPPLPKDLTEVQQNPFARLSPPAVTVPLTGIGPDGHATQIEGPPGEVAEFGRPTLIRARTSDSNIAPGNLRVPVGTTVRWWFPSRTSHDITVADGPMGFASAPLSRGRHYRRTFTKAGTYKVFCSLHPVQMTQRIEVVEKG